MPCLVCLSLTWWLIDWLIYMWEKWHNEKQSKRSDSELNQAWKISEMNIPPTKRSSNYLMIRRTASMRRMNGIQDPMWQYWTSVERRKWYVLQQWLWVWGDGLLWDLLWLVPLLVLEIQEDVGLLDKKDYMCCFCMASRTLSLVREIKSLWEEVERMHKQNKCGSKEGSSSTKLKGTNTDEISCTDNNRSSREATCCTVRWLRAKRGTLRRRARRDGNKRILSHY